MSRFEKKCVIGSATLHGFLILVFVCGSAFLSSQPPKDIGPVVTFENVTVTDGQSHGGGNPKVQHESPPPAPQPEPPKAETVKSEPIKEPTKQEPAKSEPVKLKEPDVKPLVKTHGDLPVKPTKKEDTKEAKPKSLISTTVVKRSNDVLIAQQRAATERAAKEADRKYREEVARAKAEKQKLADAVNGIIDGTGKALSKSTVVGTAGPGGEAFVNYGSLVREVYERAWRISPDLTDDDSSTLVKVTIRRDGSVAHSAISQKSSNASLNKSVQRALDSVSDIGKPFPIGAKEAERTFTIEFNLKTRRGIG